MEITYEEKYCKKCHNMVYATDNEGNDVCPICGSMEFEIKVLNKDDKIKCSMCGKTRTVEELRKTWGNIPFFNSEEMCYYCGCRGWD